MPPDQPKRRRVVTSCTQCYSKKQKCNHQYPCDHCTRRRRPELCSYAWHELRSEESSAEAAASEESPSPDASLRSFKDGSGIAALIKSSTTEGSILPRTHMRDYPYEANLSSCFGYFEASSSNLMGIMHKYGLLDGKECETAIHNTVPEELVPEIIANFRLLPKRPILHCLVENFFSEVNWIHGLISTSSFFSQYERWWNAMSPRCICDIEYGILLLRMCAYSAQFLPSRGYTADTICGASISSVREQCHRLAICLTRICESGGGMRSFIGVQSLCLGLVFLKNEGRIKEAWYLMGNLVTIAYHLGLHLEGTSPQWSSLNELEKEMRRRVFWNLYIWDRHWGLVLDRSPYIQHDYCKVSHPKMRLVSNSNNNTLPDAFLERTLQAELAKQWYSTLHELNSQSSNYDPVAAEEHYDRLWREFISTLPAPFDLDSPCKQWDKLSPKLACQRQMLRISIFSLLCNIYRSLLLLKQSQVDAMPRYKRDMIPRHRTRLINAATCLLDSVAQLHSEMGGNQTRFFLISFYTFEPAILLGVYLLSVSKINFHAPGAPEYGKQPVLDHADMMKSPISSSSQLPTEECCRQEISKALKRLDMLREVSPIAELGAQKVHQMVAHLDQARARQGSEPNGLIALVGSSVTNKVQELCMQDDAEIESHTLGNSVADGEWLQALQKDWIDGDLSIPVTDAGNFWAEALFPDSYSEGIPPRSSRAS